MTFNIRQNPGIVVAATVFVIAAVVAVWYFFIRDADETDDLTFRFLTASGVRGTESDWLGGETKSARYDPHSPNQAAYKPESMRTGTGRLLDATGMGGAVAKQTWFARGGKEGGNDRQSPVGARKIWDNSDLAGWSAEDAKSVRGGSQWDLGNSADPTSLTKSASELQQGADMTQQEVKNMLDAQAARRSTQVVGYDAAQAARRSSQPQQFPTGLQQQAQAQASRQEIQSELSAQAARRGLPMPDQQAQSLDNFRPAAANNLLVPEYQYVANTSMSTRSGKKDHSDRTNGLLPGGAKMIEGFGQIRPINTSQSVVNPSLDMRPDFGNL